MRRKRTRVDVWTMIESTKPATGRARRSRARRPPIDSRQLGFADYRRAVKRRTVAAVMGSTLLPTLDKRAKAAARRAGIDSDRAVNASRVAVWNACQVVELEDVQNRAAFFGRVAANAVVDEQRSDARVSVRQVCVEDEVLELEPDTAANPEEMACLMSEKQRVRDAVRSLSRDEQRFVRLRWVEGLSHKEIAEALGLSPRTVGRREVGLLEQLRVLLIRG